MRKYKAWMRASSYMRSICFYLGVWLFLVSYYVPVYLEMKQ